MLKNTLCALRGYPMTKNHVLSRIKENYQDFTNSQKKIGSYIHSNYRKVIYMTALELAKELDVSDATIIRFARSMGFSNFSELRDAIRSEIGVYDAPHERLSRSLEFEEGADSLLLQAAKNDFSCHEHFYNNIDYALIDATAEEIGAAETIHIVGIGTDMVVALFLEWYLTQMGFRTVCYTDGGFGFANKFSAVKSTDLVIMCCTPRHLKDEKRALKTARSKDARIVTLTTPRAVDIMALSDISLTVETKSNEFLNSYVTYMGLCNLILIRVLEKDRDRIVKKLEENSSVMNEFDLFD